MTSTFSNLDWIALIGFGSLVYLTTIDYAHIKAHYEFVEKARVEKLRKGKHHYTLLPMPALQGTIWAIIYAMIVAAIQIFWMDARVTNWNYVTVLTLFIAAQAFQKVWSVIYFVEQYYGISFIVLLVLVWAPAGAIVGLTAYEAYIHNTVIWTSFALFTVYFLAITWSLISNFLVYRMFYGISLPFVYYTDPSGKQKFELRNQITK